MEYNWIDAGTTEGLQRLLTLLNSGCEVIVRRSKKYVSSWKQDSETSFREDGGARYYIDAQAPTVEFLDLPL